MPQIFLSHSSDDKDRVTELCNVLEELGYPVWIDNRLAGGQEWWDRILAEIRASDYFGITLTQSTIRSEACQRECEYALALNKVVLPFRLEDDVDIEMLDPSLSRLQIINYGSGDKAGTLQLVRALNNLPEPAPLPDPLPPPPEIPLSYVSKILSEINRRDVLSQDEQITIVFKLRDHLRSGGDPQSVTKALRLLQARRDLYANVSNEIEAVLADLPATGSGARRAEPAPPRASTRRQASQPAPVEMAAGLPASFMSAPDGPLTAHGPAAGFVGAPAARTDALGVLDIVMMGLSFLIPIVGLVLFFVWRQDRPRSAKRVAYAAAAGFAFYLMMSSGY